MPSQGITSGLREPCRKDGKSQHSEVTLVTIVLNTLGLFLSFLLDAKVTSPKVIMSKYPFRAVLQSLPVGLALVLAQSGSLFAQERSFAAFPPAFREPGTMDMVETASTVEGPSAPEKGTVIGAAPILLDSAAVMEPMALVPVTVQQEEPTPHTFWDAKNRALFATVDALAAVDFYATHANLASGGKELNPVTRVFTGSTPALATNFALEAGAAIGISYMFHKTGHHKLERITALVNIGTSGGIQPVAPLGEVAFYWFGAFSNSAVR